ncbi:hypothetical protein E2320_001490 [Naja naja]|nr:hypothetical protein E2320_001490 [Naja naja]
MEDAGPQPVVLFAPHFQKTHSIDTPRDVLSKILLVETVTPCTVLYMFYGMDITFLLSTCPYAHLSPSARGRWRREKVLRSQKPHTTFHHKDKSEQIPRWTSALSYLPIPCSGCEDLSKPGQSPQLSNYQPSWGGNCAPTRFAPATVRLKKRDPSSTRVWMISLCPTSVAVQITLTVECPGEEQVPVSILTWLPSWITLSFVVGRTYVSSSASLKISGLQLRLESNSIVSSLSFCDFYPTLNYSTVRKHSLGDYKSNHPQPECVSPNRDKILNCITIVYKVFSLTHKEHNNNNSGIETNFHQVQYQHSKTFVSPSF